MWGSFKESFLGRSSSKEDQDNEKVSHMTKDAMKNVVTPQSIPQFIVPPLDPGELINLGSFDEWQNSADSLDSGVGAATEEDLKKLDNSMQNCSTKSNNSSPSMTNKSGLVKGKSVDQQHHPGLSLQHLLLVKRGFSTLTESPNTRRKESLFLSPPLPIRESRLSPDYKRQDGMQGSSSDSDQGKNISPLASPFERLRTKRLLARSGCDSDSNSSHQSTPFSSPARQRKFSKKKSLDVYAHCSTFDATNSPPNIRRSHRNEPSKSPTSPSLSIHCTKEENNLSVGGGQVLVHHLRPTPYTDRFPVEAAVIIEGKLEKSYSSSNITCDERNEKDCHELPLIDCPKIKVKLAYLANQEKINISIVEAENFFVGRLVYLKVALHPRCYGSQRTDSIKATSSHVTLHERLTFELVKEEDIQQLSLEVSCKEKLGRLRASSEVGKSITTLCQIDKQSSNEFWVELKPPDLKEHPHMQLSLCYDAMLGFVVAEVIAVRNIPKGSLGRYPDSYVVLAEEPQCDKNKKKQTEIKYRSKDPTFNQSFVFSMSNDQLIIAATLFVRDKIKGNWVAKGEIKLGQDVEHWTGQSHWAQALANAGTPVTLWHLLTPP